MVQGWGQVHFQLDENWGSGHSQYMLVSAKACPRNQISDSAAFWFLVFVFVRCGMGYRSSMSLCAEATASSGWPGSRRAAKWGVVLAKLRTLVARKLGYDLARLRKGNSSEALTYRLMRASAPSVVLDVGANEGQFAVSVLSFNRSERIVSFEPLSKTHEILTGRARRYPNWSVAPRMAIGAEAGTAEINISEFTGGSSLLPVTQAHLDAAPLTAYVGREETPVLRLDVAALPFIRQGDRIYLKIDTQGFEKPVLEGATGILERVVAIQAELSLVQCYEGEPLAFEMIDFIRSLGFAVFGFSNGTYDRKSHVLLQVDVFFIRVPWN